MWSAAAEVLPSAGFAVLSIIAARVLGSDAVGRQSLIAYVNVALAAVVIDSLGSAGLRLLGLAIGNGDEVLEAELGSWLVKMHVVAGVVIGVVLTAIGEALREDRLAWFVIGVVAAIDAVISGIGARFAARHGWERIGRMQLVAQLASAPLGIAGVLIGFGIAGIFLGSGIAAAGLLVVMAWRIVPVFGRRPHPALSLRPPIPVVRSWLNFGVAQLMVQIVARRVEFVVLAIFSSDSQIATYSVAFVIVNLMAVMPAFVARAAMPLVAAAQARGELDQTTRHAYFAVRLGSLVSIPLVAGLCAVGPVLVSVAYGSNFTEAARLVPLASLVLLFSVAGGVCGQYWAALGRVDVVTIVCAIAAVVDLTVAFALIPFIGAIGAIIANLAGQIAASAGLLVYTHRKLGRFHWQWRRMFAMAAASALAAGATLAVVRRLTGSVEGGTHALAAVGALLTGLVIGVALLAYLIVVLKVLVQSEREWLRPLLPGWADRALAVISVT